VLVLCLYDLLRVFLAQLGGKVLFAPLRLQIRPGKQREPDILLVRDAADPRRQNRFWTRRFSQRTDQSPCSPSPAFTRRWAIRIRVSGNAERSHVVSRWGGEKDKSMVWSISTSGDAPAWRC
jgi:hypothetical protein